MTSVVDQQGPQIDCTLTKATDSMPWLHQTPTADFGLLRGHQGNELTVVSPSHTALCALVQATGRPSPQQVPHENNEQDRHDERHQKLRSFLLHLLPTKRGWRCQHDVSSMVVLCHGPLLRHDCSLRVMLCIADSFALTCPRECTAANCHQS